MSLEIKPCKDQIEESECENEDDIRTTPELLRTSPVIPDRNDGIASEFPCNENKNDKSEEMLQTEIPSNTTQSEMDREPMDTNMEVKEEPVNDEIDYNMPIGKTPLTTNVTESFQSSDMNGKLCVSTGMGNQEDIPNNEHLDVSSAKTTLDEYLDGLATPLMPRLRVKTEFSLQKTLERPTSPQNDCLHKDSDDMDTDILTTAPPAIFSSNSNSNFVADGIATPRISLAPTNRLRVKTEFSIPSATPKRNEEDTLQLPIDYFDDLMDIKIADVESGEVSPSASEDASGDEPIPQDFFDDLLRDKLKERIQAAQNDELEEKYSDRLKELERLKKIEEKSKELRKNRKKQKKSKKKSRKRSKSRSLSPSSRAKDRDFNDFSYHDKNKRSRISPLPPRTEMPSTSNYANREIMDGNLLRRDAVFKSEFPSNDWENIGKEPTSYVENAEEIEEVLTPKHKKEKAIKRATALLKRLKEISDDNSNVFSTFSFVSTVRKLPTSISYVQQQMYENRSPLHTVNNVSYKFNSHTIRFNMEEWGLAALPPNAAKMAKLIGCDAQFIHNKLNTIKIPAKLKKVKQERNNDDENDEEEDLIQTTSSLYCNVMTQTDDISEFAIPRKETGYEIGIQVEPSVYSIACQTLETKSPTENIHKDDEAPIMKILHDLNENQLMAIHAFAELIEEPNTSTNAMEMYKIQRKILDIYKMSQIPSDLVTAQPPIVNNYSTMTTKFRGQPPICIKSVIGADGKQFSSNDPRGKSAAYAKRTANNDVDSSSNYDSRYSLSQPSHARSSTNESFSHSPYSRSIVNEGRHYSSSSTNLPFSHQRQNHDYNNQSPPRATKHFGRGALRR